MLANIPPQRLKSFFILWDIPTSSIMTQYNNGEITKEEADSQLAEKYGPAAKLTKMTITNIE
ncbi:MAG TPA: hypothetical protein DEP27_06705 [Ruminococcaceae bacterium]|nr:hypothetical protein [Oscillospiraceae bacterium]